MFFVLAILDSLNFLINQLVSFYKNAGKNFDGDCVKSWGEFVQRCHFNNVEFSNP